MRYTLRMGFTEEVAQLNGGKPRILELGTRRSEPDISTIQKAHYPFAGEYVCTDMQPGIDVDVVADLHCLSKTFGAETFDVVLSFSVFEHVKYPLLAAHEIMKVLRIAGHVFVQTHFTYHEHGYPYDYYRYTREGLEALFPRTMGMKTRVKSYHYPVEIHSERVPWVAGNQAFLNVHFWGEKVGATPDIFLPDLEDLTPPDVELEAFRADLSAKSAAELENLRDQFRACERTMWSYTRLLAVCEALHARAKTRV